MVEKVLNWYPIRVFFGRFEIVRKVLEEDGIDYFYPSRLVEKSTPEGLRFVEEPLVRSLLFVKTDLETLRQLRVKLHGTISTYNDRLTANPLVVPDKQMEKFKELCLLRESGLEYLGDDQPKYHMGDKVRVTEGVFKGFEGHIKRIRHDRKLIVTIEGVAAFATRYIPPSYLEMIK